MTKINLKSYINDTLKNLANILKKISNDKYNLFDYEKRFQIEYTNKNNKMVVFIGGSQISGSVSPFMHTYSSFINNYPFLYILFDIKKENTQINDIFNFINENKNILGANVTMPCKVDIFNILDNLGNLDSSAKFIGAVNTLARIDGKIVGFNTDLLGILEPIQEKLGNNIKLIEKGYILGSGGAARAAVGALLKLGIDDITIFNRSEESMVKLLDHFNSDEISSLIDHKYNISIIKYDQKDENNNLLANYIDKPGIIINTLPFGFKQDLPKYPVLKKEFDGVFSNILLYYDLVYDLNYTQTPIIQFIQEKYPNILICDGIDMVVSQGKIGYNLWSKSGVFQEKKIKKILRLR